MGNEQSQQGTILTDPSQLSSSLQSSCSNLQRFKFNQSNGRIYINDTELDSEALSNLSLSQLKFQFLDESGNPSEFCEDENDLANVQTEQNEDGTIKNEADYKKKFLHTIRALQHNSHPKSHFDSEFDSSQPHRNHQNSSNSHDRNHHHHLEQQHAIETPSCPPNPIQQFQNSVNNQTFARQRQDSQYSFSFHTDPSSQLNNEHEHYYPADQLCPDLASVKESDLSYAEMSNTEEQPEFVQLKLLHQTQEQENQLNKQREYMEYCGKNEINRRSNIRNQDQNNESTPAKKEAAILIDEHLLFSESNNNNNNNILNNINKGCETQDRIHLNFGSASVTRVNLLPTQHNELMTTTTNFDALNSRQIGILRDLVVQSDLQLTTSKDKLNEQLGAEPNSHCIQEVDYQTINQLEQYPETVNEFNRNPRLSFDSQQNLIIKSLNRSNNQQTSQQSAVAVSIAANIPLPPTTINEVTYDSLASSSVSVVLKHQLIKGDTNQSSDDIQLFYEVQKSQETPHPQKQQEQNAKQQAEKEQFNSALFSRGRSIRLKSDGINSQNSEQRFSSNNNQNCEYQNVCSSIERKFKRLNHQSRASSIDKSGCFLNSSLSMIQQNNPYNSLAISDSSSQYMKSFLKQQQQNAPAAAAAEDNQLAYQTNLTQSVLPTNLVQQTTSVHLSPVPRRTLNHNHSSQQTDIESFSNATSQMIESKIIVTTNNKEESLNSLLQQKSSDNNNNNNSNCNNSPAISQKFDNKHNEDNNIACSQPQQIQQQHPKRSLKLSESIDFNKDFERTPHKVQHHNNQIKSANDSPNRMQQILANARTQSSQKQLNYNSRILQNREENSTEQIYKNNNNINDSVLIYSSILQSSENQQQLPSQELQEQNEEHNLKLTAYRSVLFASENKEEIRMDLQIKNELNLVEQKINQLFAKFESQSRSSSISQSQVMNKNNNNNNKMAVDSLKYSQYLPCSSQINQQLSVPENIIEQRMSSSSYTNNNSNRNYSQDYGVGNEQISRVNSLNSSSVIVPNHKSNQSVVFADITAGTATEYFTLNARQQEQQQQQQQELLENADQFQFEDLSPSELTVRSMFSSNQKMNRKDEHFEIQRSHSFQEFNKARSEAATTTILSTPTQTNVPSPSFEESRNFHPSMIYQQHHRNHSNNINNSVISSHSAISAHIVPALNLPVTAAVAAPNNLGRFFEPNTYRSTDDYSTKKRGSDFEMLKIMHMLEENPNDVLPSMRQIQEQQPTHSPPLSYGIVARDSIQLKVQQLEQQQSQFPVPQRKISLVDILAAKQRERITSQIQQHPQIQKQQQQQSNQFSPQPSQKNHCHYQSRQSMPQLMNNYNNNTNDTSVKQMAPQVSEQSIIGRTSSSNQRPSLRQQISQQNSQSSIKKDVSQSHSTKKHDIESSKKQLYAQQSFHMENNLEKKTNIASSHSFHEEMLLELKRVEEARLRRQQTHQKISSLYKQHKNSILKSDSYSQKENDHDFNNGSLGTASKYLRNQVENNNKSTGNGLQQNDRYQGSSSKSIYQPPRQLSNHVHLSVSNANIQQKISVNNQKLSENNTKQVPNNPTFLQQQFTYRSLLEDQNLSNNKNLLQSQLHQQQQQAYTQRLLKSKTTTQSSCSIRQKSQLK